MGNITAVIKLGFGYMTVMVLYLLPPSLASIFPSSYLLDLCYDHMFCAAGGLCPSIFS